MYTAIIAKAHTRPHPGADRLQLATVAGYQVVVGKDVEGGALGVFFPSDGALSEPLCEANDLIAKFEERDGKKVRLNTGYFDEKRKVRCQKMRGEKSEGLWLPLSALAFTGADLSVLREGDMLTELNGVKLCQRYETAATKRAQGQRPQKVVKTKTLLPEHVETHQYRFYADKIPVGASVYLTEKLHGTSHRIGHVPTRTTLPAWKQRVLNVIDRILGVKRINEFVEAYGIAHGSRRVVLNDGDNGGYYGTNEFRYKATGAIVPAKGELIYGELVGFVAPNSPIMNRQTIDKKELPDVAAQYGAKMEYSYGCPDGQQAFYVYRISHLVNADTGQQRDLTWPEVKRRCAELGLQHVPELCPVALVCEDQDDRETVKQIVEKVIDGPSTIDNRHIREGVGLRIESADGVTFLKAKNFTFRFLEGIAKLDETSVDLEEAS